MAKNPRRSLVPSPDIAKIYGQSHIQQDTTLLWDIALSMDVLGTVYGQSYIQQGMKDERGLSSSIVGYRSVNGFFCCNKLGNYPDWATTQA